MNIIDHSRTCLGMILPHAEDVDYCLKNRIISSTRALLQESSHGTVDIEFINGEPQLNIEKHKKNLQEAANRRYLLLDVGSIVLLTSDNIEEVYQCTVTGKCEVGNEYAYSLEDLANRPEIKYPNKIQMRVMHTWKSREELPNHVQAFFEKGKGVGYVRLFEDATVYVPNPRNLTGESGLI